MSASDPDITINGHKLAKHHGWVVKQAVLLMAAKVKHFEELGADSPVINDCAWMLDDVVKAMSPDMAPNNAAG